MFKTLFKWFRSPAQDKEKLYKAQEIWWCVTDGSERPVLVFRKLAHHTFWGLPLSSQGKGLYVIPQGKGALSKMRILDSQQLLRRLGKMNGKQFAGLNMRVILSLQESDPLRKQVPIRTVLHRAPRPMLPVRQALRAPLFPRTYILKPAL